MSSEIDLLCIKFDDREAILQQGLSIIVEQPYFL